MKKNFLIVCLVFLFTSCEYQPLYKNTNLQNINYKIIAQSGDQQINKLIINNLKKNNSEDKTETYNIKLDTSYDKKILAKDNFGSPTSYELTATSKIIVNTNEKEVSFSMSEKFNYKNLKENYEQSNYENIIKKNLASNISEKLIIKLATIK